MHKIILPVGPPAIGKSTWALEEVRKSNGKFKRLNLDELRAMYGVTTFNPSEERLIQQTMYDAAERLLNKGYNIIADNTNLSSKSWHEWNELAKKVGDCTVEEKHFDVNITLKELKRRNSLRDRVVPEDVIERMYNKWMGMKPRTSTYYPPNNNLLHTSEKYAADMGKKHAIIVDLDGTLAINTSRNIFDWSRVYEDDVNFALDSLLLELANDVGYKFFFITGRSDVCYDDTLRWLKDKTYIGSFDDIELIMKPESIRNTKDVEFKKSVYNNKIKDKYLVFAVFEDRKRVVEMWRSLNLPVYAIGDGNY